MTTRVPRVPQGARVPQVARVPIVRPDLGEVEAEAAARVVRSGWIMQGPEVAAFEAELASAVGAPHAVGVSSGTAALELALRALGIGPGDEVVTVSHSFIATANAVMAVGARPVFVDVEADTLGMDPAQAEAALSARTKAILCVHQLGIPCDLRRLLAIGLPVVEDAACALGSEARLDGQTWQRIGRPAGKIACFSFHPRKVVTTGEGGMLTTSDGALAERLRRLRNHGLDGQGGQPGDVCLEPGFNLRMSDLAAAVGRPQLARLDAALAERRRLAAAFTSALADHPVLAPLVERPDGRTNWQSFPATLRDGAPAQDVILRFFEERGIACRPGLTNAHEEPAYRSGRLAERLAERPGARAFALPVSERLRRRTVLLPLFQGMTAEEKALVQGAIAELASTRL